MKSKPFAPLVVGLLCGAAISAVDNFTFDGEISPIVIVGMLLLVAGTLATIWGTRALTAAVLAWTWLPSAHVLKHAFGLPDTMHPNTYSSILALAAFSLVITAVRFGLGLMLGRVLHLGPYAG